MTRVSYTTSLQTLLSCDHRWGQEVLISQRDKVAALTAYHERRRLHEEISYDPDRVIVPYGRMWDRLADLNIDVCPFVDAEKFIIDGVGFERHYASLRPLLKCIKLSMSDVGVRRLNSRQHHYVFDGRVQH